MFAILAVVVIGSKHDCYSKADLMDPKEVYGIYDSEQRRELKFKDLCGVRFVFVGNGSMTEVLKVEDRGRYCVTLQELVRSLNLEDRIIFTGHIHRS